MQPNVNTSERWTSIAAGSGLWLYARRGSGLARAGACLMGLGFLARGVLGWCPVKSWRAERDDTKRALGGPRGVHVKESAVVEAPVETLFSVWREATNLPQVLPFLERVDRIDDRRSHWVVSGPAGSHLEWDAEVIHEVPLQTIGWRSLPGADVTSAGSVRFRPVDGGRATEIFVTMQYAPPGGKLGAVAAERLDRSASEMVREALDRLAESVRSNPTPWREARIVES
jgi:uncharacterized membrane protein